jgi:hypothetical protein
MISPVSVVGAGSINCLRERDRGAASVVASVAAIASSASAISKIDRPRRAMSVPWSLTTLPSKPATRPPAPILPSLTSSLLATDPEAPRVEQHRHRRCANRADDYVWIVQLPRSITRIALPERDDDSGARRDQRERDDCCAEESRELSRRREVSDEELVVPVRQVPPRNVR